MTHKLTLLANLCKMILLIREASMVCSAFWCRSAISKDLFKLHAASHFFSRKHFISEQTFCWAWFCILFWSSAWLSCCLHVWCGLGAIWNWTEGISFLSLQCPQLHVVVKKKESSRLWSLRQLHLWVLWRINHLAGKARTQSSVWLEI